MSENLKEQHEAEIQQIQSFYLAVIDDLKIQIADLSEQKSMQVAFNAQNQQTIQQISKSNQEKDEQLKAMEKMILEEKAKYAGPVPKKEEESE